MAGCGDERIATRLQPGPAAPPQRLPLGLTEANPHLIAPGRQPAAFIASRDRIAALRLSHFRIFVDWAKTDGDLRQAQDGCLRDIRPCAAYDGVAAQFRALAARRLADLGRWSPVLTIYGVPARYAAPAHGCERPDAAPRARPITPEGLVAYRRLVADLLRLARGSGAPIALLSPWNEPNHPTFVSPQRETCDAAAPSLAPAVYAQLVAAAAAVPHVPPLLLGELAGYVAPEARATAVGEFVAALPDAVACAGAAWSVHDYAQPDGASPDAVGALEAALDARPCTAGKPIWVTETGAGGPRPGHPRSLAPGSAEAACRALAARLARWDADPRVAAVFQYTFREDPSYPVGLADAGLTRTYPTYDLLRAWATLPPGAPAPTC